MKTTTAKKNTSKSITFNQGVNIISQLKRAGFNTKSLSSDNFLNLHYLKIKLTKKLGEISEAVEQLAKDMKHEVVMVSQTEAQFRVIISEKEGNTEYGNATKEFLDKKLLLEKEPIEGLDLNFMTVDEFREWAGNLDGQFELTEFLLKEKE